MFRRFENLIDPFPAQEDTTPPTNLVGFCLHYVKGAKRLLAIMAILSALLAALEVILFSYVGELVDLVSTHSPDDFWNIAQDKLIVMGCVLVLGIPILTLLHSLLVHQSLLGNLPMRIRWQAHRQLLGQSYSFYQNEFAGRIATKVMQTALAVRETVMKILDILLYVIVYFVTTLTLALSLDWRLTLPFLVWAIVYGCILYYFLPRLESISTKQAHARSEMTGRLVDTYTNIATIKLFSHHHREEHYAKAGMTSFLDTVHPQMRLATSLNVSIRTINALLIFSVAATCLWLWDVSLITAGAIATSTGLALRLNSMAQWIMWEVSSLFENIGTARDGLHTLALPKHVTDTATSRPLHIKKADIRFDEVAFNYDGAAPVLSGFNLHIRSGEKIGLVGRSGAGKSTLVNLLLRFYDTASGKITIDGADIRHVSQDSLRGLIGMVTQDTSLLHRSIRENLIYGRPDASEEEMIAAAKQAEAHEFILSLTDNEGRTGYDAHVGERGVKLSGGQRQRIAIARVLLKNAPILIMDEATSALDSEAELAIQGNLTTLMEGKTVIAIAHRLSTIASMDRLIVLEKGQIVEQGTHAELLATGGIYAQLWQHQSGGFLGES